MRTYTSRFNCWPVWNDGFLCLAWAVILPAIFFSPHLLASDPQFNFYGDLYNAYFPQFVEGYHLAKSGTYSGIDFLTNNGASAYFLRPNFPIFYPVYQLVYILFSFETIEQFARAFVVVLYIHSVLALYFCMKVGRKYFQMDIAVSLLLGVLYFGAVADAYPIPPFFFVASLFPMLLFFVLRSAEETAWWRLVLYSFPYILVFLSGYLPLDVNAVILASIFAAVYFWHSTAGKKQIFLTLMRSLIPAALASVVVLPIYLAILQYHKLVSGLPEGVWYAAHEFSYQSNDIFALISNAFVGSRPGSEIPSIVLGIVPALLLLLAFTQRKKIALKELESKVVALSIAIFIFYLFLTFGRFSGLPDLFYYVVPGLGKMHLYGRFLPIASFFFYVVMAIAFRHLVQIRAELPLGILLVGLCLAVTLAHIYGQIGHPETVQVQSLVVELLMVGLVLVALSSRQSFHAFAAIIVVSLLVHAAKFNSHTNYFNLSSLPSYKNTVVFDSVRRDALRTYFKDHSNKVLIKYADLTSSIEKANGVMLNYPWMVQDTVKLSNYMGYDLHMSVDRDYLSRFPWFGKVSVPWLLRTGADFVIYDSAALSIYAEQLGPWINHDVPELDIGHGYKAAKLKDAAGLVDYIPARTAGDFDNGIVRVFSSTGTVNVSGFQTDFASRVIFQTDSTSPVVVDYLLFPNKMMALRVDGKPSDVTLKDGLLELSLPPGHHAIEYQYKDRLHQIFNVTYQLYIALLLIILGWRAWMMIRPSRFLTL